MEILCPKCRAVLRKSRGVHRPGEPRARYEENAYVIVCPHCGAEYRESSGGEASDSVTNCQAD